MITTNTSEIGDEKSQYAMERIHFMECGLPAFINPNGSLLHNASDFKGVSEDMNGDLSVSDTPGVEKAGGFVVISASSWSYSCSL